MNCLIEGVTVLYANGTIQVMEQVYIRGQQVRYFQVPDMLHNCPMFGARGQGHGRGLLAAAKGAMKGGKKGHGKGYKGRVNMAKGE